MLINPRLLRDDVGWQLSFLAVFGIIYIFPILEAGAEKFSLSDKWRIRSIVLVTFSVQITTLPIVIASFGIFSVYAPLANLLVLPLLPFVMIFILGALFLSWLPGFWGLIIFIPAQIGLWYFNQVAKQIASLPGSFVLIGDISVFILLFYYLFIFMVFKSLRIELGN